MSEIQGFDAGLHRAQAWRKLRRLAVMALVLGCFFELAGTPHVRVTASGSRASYWGVNGTHEVYSAAAPLIVLRPLERPLAASIYSFCEGFVEGVRNL